MPKVVVAGVPVWLDAQRLLGAGDWQRDGGAWTAERTREDAADVQARLRGLGMDGHPLEVSVRPPLKRKLVREARAVDARRRRDTSPGFVQTDVRLDDEGRWSLTPEALALALGRRASGLRVVDATCGAGGNAIGFARSGCEVIAIEQDGRRLEHARHNARTYGVADRIEFLHGDAAELLPQIEADLCFVDPPWEGYDPVRCPLDALPILVALLPHTARFERCWLKLPPSFVTADLPDFQPSAWFGVAAGDRARVKFVLLARPDLPRHPVPIR